MSYIFKIKFIIWKFKFLFLSCFLVLAFMGHYALTIRISPVKFHHSMTRYYWFSLSLLMEKRLTKIIQSTLPMLYLFSLFDCYYCVYHGYNIYIVTRYSAPGKDREDIPYAQDNNGCADAGPRSTEMTEMNQHQGGSSPAGGRHVKQNEEGMSTTDLVLPFIHCCKLVA